MIRMLTGAAAIALAASSAMAQPGNGNGNGGNGGNGNGGGRAVATAVERGPSGNGNANQRSSGREVGRADAQTGNRAIPGGLEVRPAANRGQERAAAAAPQRGAAAAGRNAVASARSQGDQRLAPVRYVIDGNRPDQREVRYSGSITGCPPGLAAKRNGCQPPGQARKTRYLQRDDYDLGWWGLPRYDDGRYRYDDGYLLRLGSNGGIASYIPLLGGALAIGNPWPTSYGYDQLTPYYTRYYGLGQAGSYRFADNVVYRVEPESSAITSIAALLTGDDFTVGQRLPSGYDVYNVPYTYRDRYNDSPDANYRYSDGYIYEVDPQTQLIASVIELLAS